MIPAIPTEELHLPISFVRENPPAVVLLLVHPSLPMEGAGDESRVHQGDVGGEGHALKYIGVVSGPQVMGVIQ